MIIRVPLLLNFVDAVVFRLDTAATRAVNPPGPSPEGYSDIFREPVVSDGAAGASVGGRVSTRREMDPVRVPCQVETSTFGDLREGFTGNLPQSRVQLVFHRADLESLGLLDPITKNVVLKIGDRIEKLEKHGSPGTVVAALPGKDGLFIREILPASWGFGPDGHDLEVAVLEQRDQGAQ